MFFLFERHFDRMSDFARVQRVGEYRLIERGIGIIGQFGCRLAADQPAADTAEQQQTGYAGGAQKPVPVTPALQSVQPGRDRFIENIVEQRMQRLINSLIVEHFGSFVGMFDQIGVNFIMPAGIQLTVDVSM
jgi:hypothetical protein